jgi:hypothetical protein
MDMLKELEEAVAQISGDGALGSADVIYGGSAVHWKAFGKKKKKT